MACIPHWVKELLYEPLLILILLLMAPEATFLVVSRKELLGM
jgi:hypothetical protein